MFEGRSQEEEQAVTAELAKALTSALSSPDHAISVAIRGCSQRRLDGQGLCAGYPAAAGLIYKKPGYDPFDDLRSALLRPIAFLVRRRLPAEDAAAAPFVRIAGTRRRRSP